MVQNRLHCRADGRSSTDSARILRGGATSIAQACGGKPGWTARRFRDPPQRREPERRTRSESIPRNSRQRSDGTRTTRSSIAVSARRSSTEGRPWWRSPTRSSLPLLRLARS